MKMKSGLPKTCRHPVEVVLTPSHLPNKKYDARIGGKTVSFGARGMSDFTLHKDLLRKQRYLSRHSKRETWTKEWLTTSGFWSRWLLWNLPTLHKSTENMQKRFCLRITS